MTGRLKGQRLQARNRAQFEHDGWECQRCGWADRSGLSLEVHHKVDYRISRAEPPAGSPWLETLCRRCHSAITGQRRGSRPLAAGDGLIRV